MESPMARSHPGQLSLFGDLPNAPPPRPLARARHHDETDADSTFACGELFETTNERLASLDAPLAAVQADAVVEAELPAATLIADRLVLAVPVSLKSSGAILAAAQTGPGDAALFSPYISVLDFGDAESIDADETEAVLEAGGAVELRRFDAAFASLGSLDDGGLALFPDETGGLDALADCLRVALRECGGPTADMDPNGPHLPLVGRDGVESTRLDRPLRLPVRDIALLHVFGDGSGYEVLKKWPLAG